MKRKLYIKPSITTVEIEAMSIMAGSIGDGGETGNIGDPEPGYGGSGHFAPSRNYFDSWEYDDNSNEEDEY